MAPTDTAVNEDGVTTTTIDGDGATVTVTVIPAGPDGPLSVEIEGTGGAVIADGGIRLDTGLAASLVLLLRAALAG